MSESPAHYVFEEPLRHIVAPALQQHGFQFNGRRAFCRETEGEEHKIEFQLGQRGLSGTFTVNLVAGTDSERLGCARVTAWSRWVERLFGERDPWWKDAFLPKDKWWKLPESEQQAKRTLTEVLSMLEAHGLRWFDVQRLKNDQPHTG